MDGSASLPMHLPRAAAVFALIFATGCQWQKPKPPPPTQIESAPAGVINVPPKQVARIVQQAISAPPLSLNVQSAHGGTILTDWKEYEGALHIVRRWQERTRFKITVLPDFEDPTGKSHVQVFDETQEKPSAQQPWYPAPDDQRPQRAVEVLNVIENAVRRGTTTPAASQQSEVRWQGTVGGRQ